MKLSEAIDLCRTSANRNGTGASIGLQQHIENDFASRLKKTKTDEHLLETIATQTILRALHNMVQPDATKRGPFNLVAQIQRAFVEVMTVVKEFCEKLKSGIDQASQA